MRQALKLGCPIQGTSFLAAPPGQVTGHRTSSLPQILTTAEPGVWKGAALEAELSLCWYSRDKYRIAGASTAVFGTGMSARGLLTRQKQAGREKWNGKLRGPREASVLSPSPFSPPGSSCPWFLGVALHLPSKYLFLV